jgi:hypothetical protein
LDIQSDDLECIAEDAKDDRAAIIEILAAYVARAIAQAAGVPRSPR